MTTAPTDPAGPNLHATAYTARAVRAAAPERRPAEPPTTLRLRDLRAIVEATADWPEDTPLHAERTDSVPGGVGRVTVGVLTLEDVTSA